MKNKPFEYAHQKANKIKDEIFKACQEYAKTHHEPEAYALLVMVACSAIDMYVQSLGTNQFKIMEDTFFDRFGYKLNLNTEAPICKL